MSYVKNSNATAPRSGYSKPAASNQKPASNDANQPTHTLSARVGEGDNVEFIPLTGMFPGQTKDGRAMMKGKPNVQVIIKTADGRELVAEQFFVAARNQ